MLLRKRL